MKKIYNAIGITLLLASNNAFSDVVDAVVSTAGNRTFTSQESDFIDNYNMSKSLMYKDAYDAVQGIEWFSNWLKENHSSIYKNNVMTKNNFPNSEMYKHNGGLADAFRHIFWTAQIAQRYGISIAEEFTDLHERVNYETNSLNAGNSEVLNKVNENVSSKSWKYYVVNTQSLHSELKVIMNSLSDDIDLYVNQGSKPTQTRFDCRSWNGGTKNETCNIDLWQSSTYYIGAFGYHSGSYNIKAFLLDDNADSTGLGDGLTPMDYHNNHIGALIGSENSDISDQDLKIKVRDYIMGDISSELNFYNSHTQLIQSKVVVYKSLSNGSSELRSFVINSDEGDADIESFYNQYPSYFGEKTGDNYSCYSSYTCQDFSDSKKIAVHNQDRSLYYNNGSQWYFYQ